ncbi:type VI secretion system accessory protein TagJ [Roseomonas sp. 18066]|uniref:type VI secretion system accessory protein TagJ n=1 Tax=Roseomonas sp. 18066 TaxID=2681412 RepID=UPI0013570BCC|nr:type VI secretion system accessory protein TagJ [Roseomonas sp. 18066]
MSTTQDPASLAFQAGDLSGALAATIAAVRGNPRDSGLRWLLAEFFLLNGEVDRADKALDAVLQAEPSPAVLEFRHLLRGEQQRHAFFASGALPRFQGDDPTPAQRAALRALTLARAGDAEGATVAAEEAETLRPRIAGSADGTAFDDFRDADDIFAPQLEVLTSGGDAMWVPLERIAQLAFEPIRRARDLAWRRATLVLKDGTEGLVFVPMLYPQKADNDAQKLGRETVWSETPGPVRGTGLRLWLAGEGALTPAEITRLDFA